MLAVATAIAAAPSAHTADEPRLTRDWRLMEGKHWQIASPDDEAAVEPPRGEDDSERGTCGPGMVEVQGEMLAGPMGDFDVVDAAQKDTCTSWIDRKFPERCARFDEDRWRSVSHRFPKRSMHFCIDRYEYPNRSGDYPWVMVTWREARALCARELKRLCTEAEWTFACEGVEAMPYPYGYVRDSEACVTDRPRLAYDGAALTPRDTARALAEVDRLWQGEPSGSRARCRSPFGVFDMTGNVDEWTTSSTPGGRRSILKGGYWGPVRTRCRASTRVHGEDVGLYQQGFRCCGDAP
jgi:formylglycine-generating enzyme required for sulfatase activity